MTSTILPKFYNDGLNTLLIEEQLVNRALERLNQLTESPNKHLITEITHDLKKIKTFFEKSEFKDRYLSNREKSLQQFIDDCPSMLGYWNRDLINVHSNNAYAQNFEKSPSEIRGKAISELLGQQLYNSILQYINGVLDGKPQTFERNIPMPDGNFKSTIANYIPHFVNDEVIGFFVIVTDISENKRLEEKAKKLESSLHEQSRLSSLGQMASNIAHEINNPVAIIYSDACLILKELKKSDPNQDYIVKQVTEIENTALRIEKIIDGLRSIHTGKAKSTPIENDVSKIVDQVLSICTHRFTNAGLKIIWNRPKTKVTAICNEIQISEILLNLLNNAFDELIKVTDGFVKIEARNNNEKCELIISNNGPEITQDQRKMLFVPFYTTKGKLGTGLGLKISKDLARANGGDLSLSNNSQTQFVLSLKSSLNSQPLL